MGYTITEQPHTDIHMKIDEPGRQTDTCKEQDFITDKSVIVWQLRD